MLTVEESSVLNHAHTQVRKRDGSTLQTFDPYKIESAIRRAWLEAENIVDETKLLKVSNTVIQGLVGTEHGVEEIQDAVEVSLMKHKMYAVAKAYIVYRDKRSAARAARQKPDATAISTYIHFSKYAQYRPDLFRREVYVETVDRVEGMHLRRFDHLPAPRKAKIKWAFDRVREMRTLPSMRSMQFGGVAIEKNNNRMYNCTSTYIDRLRVFAEALFLLLSGSGVGYSVQFDHVEKLPTLSYIDPKKVVHHVVADSIEGWADALDALVNSYTTGEYIEFSYHLIRPAGSPLKTSGGRAPGHRKLKESLEQVRKVFDGAQGRKLRPIEAHDSMCFIADAVLSGGIRRSAMICLFSLEDSEMVNAKIGNWHTTAPWRANANNSVMLKRDEVKSKSFKRIFELCKSWGEPGFYFCTDYDHSTNPCVPAGTQILTREGYQAIETRVGHATDVWNGEEWSTVTPRVTGHDQPLVRVHLSDGTSLDCTDYHEWCVATGLKRNAEERVRAVNLEVGDALMRYQMPVVESGNALAHAYTHGFWCGDGTLEDSGRKTVLLYGGKRDLLQYLDVERHSTQTAGERIRAVLPVDMSDKYVVPAHASVRSRLEWFAGLMDADGNIMINPGSLSLHLSSVNLPFLQNVRRMLTTLGVQAKIGLQREAGVTTLPDGRGGEREFATQDSYRLMISATDVHRLVTLGLKTYRLDLEKAQQKPQRDARRFVTVSSVERLPKADIVYCFTEPKNNTGTFEGIVTGQCVEIGMNPKLVIDDAVIQLLQARVEKRNKPMPSVQLGDVHTGWAFCNLCEINAARMKTYEEFVEAAEAATIIGTLQASYTDMPYLGWVSEVIAEREALLGIGMTGMMDSPEISLNAEMQQKVAAQVVVWNKDWSAAIGIEPAARTTCVKPSGTTSLELGSVGSGHHPHHARRYIRRVTADELELVFQAFKAKNPLACVRKPDGKWVVEFPVEAPEGALIKSDIGAIQFLEMVKSTQQNWVIPGTARPGSTPGLRHNVSNTVTVKPDEWDAVADFIWENRDYFTGVSLLSSYGDKVYPFAPFEAVVTEADEARWNQLIASYVPVEYDNILELEDGTTFAAEAACAGGACAI